MSGKERIFDKIPAILSIPERLSVLGKRLRRLRYPILREFSLRDALIAVGCLLLLLLSAVIRPLRSAGMYFRLAAAVAALVPPVLRGIRMELERRRLPVEELGILLATVLTALQREWTAAALIPLFYDLLCLAQAYALMHRKVASEAAGEQRLELREGLERCDVEKTEHGVMIASASLGFFLLYLLVALIFVILALFHHTETAVWLRRAVAALVLASPSSALLASSLIHFGCFHSAAEAGIAFADDRVPEEFARCRIFVFSKTGTVTDGKYVISDIAPVGISEADLLKVAAAAEWNSDHPIALALKRAAGLPEGVAPDASMSMREIPGKGVSTLYGGHQVYVGNASLLEEHGIWFRVPAKTGSAIHVAVDGSYRGYIMIADNPRENAFEALEELRAERVSTLVMLTGDVRSAARPLASSLNFDMVKPELKPAEKASAVRYLRSVHGSRARIVCVGDGNHDAEMFRQSDIAVRLEAEDGRGAEVNIFSADILELPRSFRICRTCARLLTGTLAAVAAVKLLLCVLACAGFVSVGLTAFLDLVFGLGTVVVSLLSFRLR